MKRMNEKLNKLMFEKGIKASELSRITGIPYTTLSVFLKGKTDKIDIVKLQTICNALDCSLDYLLNDEVDCVKEKQVYYLDNEVAKYAQEIAQNHELKMLFDAARNVKKEDMEFVYKMIQRFKKDTE